MHPFHSNDEYLLDGSVRPLLRSTVVSPPRPQHRRPSLLFFFLIGAFSSLIVSQAHGKLRNPSRSGGYNAPHANHHHASAAREDAARQALADKRALREDGAHAGHSEIAPLGHSVVRYTRKEKTPAEFIDERASVVERALGELRAKKDARMAKDDSEFVIHYDANRSWTKARGSKPHWRGKDDPCDFRPVFFCDFWLPF